MLIRNQRKQLRLRTGNNDAKLQQFGNSGVSSTIIPLA
jgi:hypothetical protein